MYVLDVGSPEDRVADLLHLAGVVHVVLFANIEVVLESKQSNFT